MTIETNEILELTFHAAVPHGDPFWDVTLDIEASSDAGTRLYPCYWAGGDLWKARIAFQEPGRYSLRTVCSDASDTGLHNKEFEVCAVPYSGIEPLKKHGRLRVSADRSRLEYADGTPFFWLGDTWWMGLTRRLKYPADFLTLAADRLRKGFTLIQIVAGIYPDMDEFDARGENEAGHPWTEDNRSIDPEYFKYMDARIDALLSFGLVPCIVACWGYYADVLGFDRLSRYWRYLIARYGAGNVVWCLAGEATMPWYGYHPDPEEFERRRQNQKEFWSRLAQYVRDTDPYGTLTTIHPPVSSRECVEDSGTIDLEITPWEYVVNLVYNTIGENGDPTIITLNTLRRRTAKATIAIPAESGNSAEVVLAADLLIEGYVRKTVDKTAKVGDESHTYTFEYVVLDDSVTPQFELGKYALNTANVAAREYDGKGLGVSVTLPAAWTSAIEDS
ncbi:MAG: DUF4038 domain-containing protein, partial [Abditibacteriota bacterium]|nr:DUF4038 domain-containing protein [Abditibacteriota bacterium]